MSDPRKPSDLSFGVLQEAVRGSAAAFRCRRRLQPAGGEGDKVFPPTFAGAVYAGLCAATLAFEAGMGLRSRSLLWPEGPMEWDLLDRPGATPTRLSLTSDAAIKPLNDAIAAATAVGLQWTKEPIALKPSQELIKLVRLSQLEATRESGESA